MDLLAVSNYVNYFGKSEDVDEVVISPILIRKLSTMVAIYGLGAVRDERLNRMWNQKKVKFVRPAPEQVFPTIRFQPNTPSHMQTHTHTHTHTHTNTQS